MLSSHKKEPGPGRYRSDPGFFSSGRRERSLHPVMLVMVTTALTVAMVAAAAMLLPVVATVVLLIPAVVLTGGGGIIGQPSGQQGCHGIIGLPGHSAVELDASIL